MTDLAEVSERLPVDPKLVAEGADLAPAEVHAGNSFTLIPLNIDLGGLFGDRDAPCSGGSHRF